MSNITRCAAWQTLKGLILKPWLIIKRKIENTVLNNWEEGKKIIKFPKNQFGSLN